MKHKLESILLEEISTTSDMQMIPHQWLWRGTGESEEEWNSLLMKVKDESEKADLKLNIKKAKIMASGPISSDSLRPYGLQHPRPPYPSPTPGVYSNSCPLNWWCHPNISSSVTPFSSRLQSFPASGSFPRSQFFTSGAKVLEFQLQHQSFQWIFRTDFL